MNNPITARDPRTPKAGTVMQVRCANLSSMARRNIRSPWYKGLSTTGELSVHRKHTGAIRYPVPVSYMACAVPATFSGTQCAGECKRDRATHLIPGLHSGRQGPGGKVFSGAGKILPGHAPRIGRKPRRRSFPEERRTLEEQPIKA